MSDFEVFREFLQDSSGIFLAENKQYLVSTRIRRLLDENGLKSLTELVQELKRSRHSRLRQAVIDAMTTNETFWFRDTYPFDYLKSTLLPEMMAAGSAPLRIWSAACSSGQEAYSISMSFEEYRRIAKVPPRRNIEIVGTDLSSAVLDAAKAGEYDKMSIGRGLSRERLDMFFDEAKDQAWRVKPAVKSRVSFKSLNLMDPYISMGKFDIIFCRNVLIYFNGDLKRDILRRMHASLNPGGILFLGSSEGLAGVSELFEMINCSPGIVYKAIK